MRGIDLDRLDIVPDGAIAINQGIITGVGKSSELIDSHRGTSTKIIDASNNVALPGFIDPHTHSLFIGERHEDFEVAIRGYGERHGIMQTVKED